MDYHHQPPMGDSASKISKLCIKIKIPNTPTFGTAKKPVGEGGRGSTDVQRQPNGYRVCEFCGKIFSSGKAWGGHKRHHLKIMKNNNGKRTQQVSHIKMKKKMHGGSNRCNTIKAGDVTITGGKPTCCLCGKTFLSINSLFGHMRFHPDRDWKGIRPPSSPPPPRPPKNQISSALEMGAYSSIDLLDSLSSSGSWQKKGKRGICAADLMAEAARSLLRLSRDVGLSTQPAYVDLETSRSATKSLGKDIRTETGSGSDDIIMNGSDEFCELETKKKRRKMNYINKLSNYETEPCEFKYSSCDKSFSTFHALGVHSSSFNCKKKSNELESESALIDDDASATEEIPATESGDETEETAEDEPDLVSSMETSFHSDIRNQTDPTGQALGGHKKALSNEAVSAEASNVESQTASSEKVSAIQAGHGMIGIDLNKPYVMQDGEGNLNFQCGFDH